jgi:hypothetical protein
MGIAMPFLYINLLKKGWEGPVLMFDHSIWLEKLESVMINLCQDKTVHTRNLSLMMEVKMLPAFTS